MCGIFAYIGSKNDAAKTVLSGLKTLEYRGYDSWGIAVKKGDRLEFEKHVGKIGDAKTVLPESNLGIGHTRWATHGGVTDTNAHPHLDCNHEIAVIHNGIIENFQELRAELTKKGHKFLSETDTEVVTHLIEEYAKTEEFTKSVRLAFNRLSGMNAVVAMNGKSEEIVAAKNGSPLVVGIADDGYLLASDAAGILRYTKKVLFLEDHRMVTLNKDLKLFELPEGKEVEPKIETLDWEFEEAELGKYKHFFIKEIHEEPRVINNIALNGIDSAKTLAKLIEEATGTFLIACGSASYAATGAVYLFSKIAKKHVNFAVGSEFKYIEDFIIPQTLVIPISQSGESIDVIEPTTKAKNEKGAKIASIVNVLGSTLYRLSDFNFLLGTGPEKAVVATKSFSAMIAAVLLTAYSLAGQAKKGQELLTRAATNVTQILGETYTQMVIEVAEKLKDKQHIYIIGRGVSYLAALEATLKIKEATYIHAEAFPGGELKHGVIALIEKGTPCIVFAPNDETYDEIVSNAQEIKARGGHIIGIGPKNNEVFDDFLETDDIEEATLLPQVTVAHMLGYYLALAKGVPDPDKPRNLAKSVTVK
ncbi:MAG TPA: glutamine--fructose-6-phosphate transaminase (isomerizing) [Patescibacteria group bacterium]|nr:glutamine--fructose-6-phosphate transaminase (isomerizing) [Patescibacteria group bacterium]